MISENNKNILESILNEKAEGSEEEIIENLNPEETKVALEILEEELEGTQEDTPEQVEELPEPEGEDTQEEPEEEEGEGETQEEDFVSQEEDFILDKEIIDSHPEEDRGILNKYIGKSKKDIAIAVANAIAVKNPVIKDDKEAIEALAEKLATKSDEDLIKKLIQSQRIVGQSTTQTPKEKEKGKELELPEFPEDNPKFKEILEKEALKRLKSKYKTMPDVDNMSNEEYLEWRRDLDIEDPDNTFREDKNKTLNEVRDELRKVIFVQKELSNLYDNSPDEILPILNEQTYPRLKALNDRPQDVLFEDVKKEVENIKSELNKLGLSEKDLGIDLTIVKDESGMPFNQVLNELVVKGIDASGNPILEDGLIGRRGKTFWLIPGQLSSKFMSKYNSKIMTSLIEKKIRDEKIRREELRDTALIQPKGTSGDTKRIVSLEDIDNETNPEVIKRLVKELEKSI